MFEPFLTLTRQNPVNGATDTVTCEYDREAKRAALRDGNKFRHVAEGVQDVSAARALGDEWRVEMEVEGFSIFKPR